MQSQRFFIGNLPAGTNENEVKKAFQDFGDVTNVELKAKENLVDPSNVKLLAFVTLNLYNDDVDYCLRKLNNKEINGEYVKVSVAKESFLERLKREREESSKKSSKTPSTNNYELRVPYNEAQVQYNEVPNKSKKFFDTEDVAEPDDENLFDDGEPVLITKKRAANSMRNGKIVIEGTNAAPITVIGKQKEVKLLSDKSFDADKKRKESVNKKKNQYQLQKSLIQKSLASVDASKNKQIFFDNDEEDTNTPSDAKQLFQDDSDQEEGSVANDFAMKPEYEGAKGAALMKLQSKMSLDPRFKIDSKFVDKVDEDEPVKNENSERDWQYGILEQVVGTKFSNTTQGKDPKKNKLNMLRYDPSKENQDQFLIKRKQAEPMEVEEEDDEENVIPQTKEKKVSKEVFYMVSENLSNSLKVRGDGFSLLSMFGRAASDENEVNEERTSKEKILISKTDKTGEVNPFSYDSSSESENEQESKPKIVEDESQTVKIKESKKSAKPKLFVESFFMSKNDVRLKEGKSFFRSNKLSEKIVNYDEVKNKLKNIINKKITKSKKQLKGIGKQKSIRSR
ncbi:probable RNA-binding protein CG14230 [Eupeodes corollae]|uniref:probable RNA-binding protein CG14230 n=1 Tax=Eupeodes corollae TaxID=290404 RepID=UPI00248F65EC|nr:probable RNA-binding protein CG14230 [Eupeodes corollae]